VIVHMGTGLISAIGVMGSETVSSESAFEGPAPDPPEPPEPPLPFALPEPPLPLPPAEPPLPASEPGDEEPVDAAVGALPADVLAGAWLGGASGLPAGADIGAAGAAGTAGAAATGAAAARGTGIACGSGAAFLGAAFRSGADLAPAPAPGAPPPLPSTKVMLGTVKITGACGIKRAISRNSNAWAARAAASDLPRRPSFRSSRMY
jgi:hypothetical protein